MARELASYPLPPWGPPYQENDPRRGPEPKPKKPAKKTKKED